MRINNKSKIETERLTPLLKFASTGVKDSGTEIHVKNSSTGWFSGMAYADPQNSEYCNVAKGVKHLVTIKIPTVQCCKNFTEHRYWQRMKRLQAAYPDGFPYESWEDEFIHLVAHEFRHIWQYQHNAKSKGEYDAEMHALRILNKWREHGNRPVIAKTKQANPFA